MTDSHLRVMTRPGLVTVVLAVLILVGGWQAVSLAAASGNGNGNNGHGNGNGGSTGASGSASPGKAFAVSVLSTTTVAPGKAGSVTITVTNPNNQAAILTSLSGAVTGVGSGARPGLQKCQASWITLGTWTGSKNVAGNTSTTLTMPVSLSNTATNQDNCKGMAYTFSFLVNGQQA